MSLTQLNQEKADEIVRLRKNGTTIDKIAEQLGWESSNVKRYIRALNNPKSNIYNPKSYKEIHGINKGGKNQLNVSLNKKIVSLLLDRKSKKEIEQKYDIDREMIERHIENLNNPNSNVYDSETYEKIQLIQKELEIEEEKAKKEQLIKDLNTIEEHLKLGHSATYISDFVQISRYRTDQCLEALKTPDSGVYDEERYIELTTLKEQLGNQGKVENAFVKNNDLSSPKLVLAQLIGDKKITIEEAAKNLHIPILVYYDYLNNITNRDLAAKLRPILQQFQPINPVQYKSLKENNESVLKELLMVVLTYRVSLDMFAEWFHTTKEDVLEAFSQFGLDSSLTFLERSIAYKSMDINEQAYLKARAYWKKRNQYIKQYTIAKKLQNFQIYTENKMKLEEHRKQVYDNKIIRILNSNFNGLSIEDRELVARYRLKYGLSYEECIWLLHLEEFEIKKCENELVTKDLIYASELITLNSFLEEQQRKQEIVVYEGRTR